MNDNKLITVVETAEFIKQAEKFMSDESKREFINYIATNSCSGDLIEGTGGVRKVRWANDATKGKSGGSRVIYFYHNDDMPLFYLQHIQRQQKRIFLRVIGMH